ncbi:MAG: PH domain-containing protein [Candidatus ainarchaeum sp.]|nr:PH domain-containing protein [Candidatus ainarchaeum sp.]
MAIEDNLSSGEKVLRKFYPSFWNYWAWYLLGALLIFPGVILLVVPALVGILIILWKELARRGTTYLVTDRRIMKEVGITGKTTTSTIYQKVTDVRSSQSMIQRMLGIGDIYVNTAGGEGPEIVMRGIGDMPGVKRQIEEAWAGTKSG